jgi:hypothetical protein
MAIDADLANEGGCANAKYRCERARNVTAEPAIEPLKALSQDVTRVKTGSNLVENTLGLSQ